MPRAGSASRIVWSAPSPNIARATAVASPREVSCSKWFQTLNHSSNSSQHVKNADHPILQYRTPPGRRKAGEEGKLRKGKLTVAYRQPFYLSSPRRRTVERNTTLKESKFAKIKIGSSGRTRTYNPSVNSRRRGAGVHGFTWT